MNPPQVPQLLWVEVAPFVVLCIWALAIVLVDLFLPVERRRLALPLGFLGVVLIAYLSVQAFEIPASTFTGMLVLDTFAFFCIVVILAGGALTILISPRYVQREHIPHGEYTALLLFAMLGMILLAASNELITLLLSLEILSVSLYILSGAERHNPRSTEAALKYFLLGAFSTAFFIMGIAFLYGATGTTFLPSITEHLIASPHQSALWVFIGFGLVLAGFCFKLALAPLHMWAPDVYEGAPTPITAFIATGSKVAGFAALWHVVVSVADWQPVAHNSFYILWLIAVLSMVIGNVAAIVQKNIKRLLAYSSIAHSGYILVSILVIATAPAVRSNATQALIYYLMAYTLMNILAFGVAIACGRKGDREIEHYAGLARTSPLLAAAMALAMLSLTGVPPTVGFVGKFYIFSAAIQAGYLDLAIIGVLASVISAFYYLRVIVVMYMYEPSRGAAEPAYIPEPVGAANGIALLVSSVMIILLGIFPFLFLGLK
jgi:NADH-quinone oxidoreductase subunit N